jgi:hypothetical protein
MPYLARELITRSYYQSGIVSREFETVSGSQIQDGLDVLNELLQEKSVDWDMIPYETTYSGNFVIGQEAYAINDLIAVDTFTFTKDSVRYSMEPMQRDQYFGSTRVNNINSLPNSYYVERSYTPNQGIGTVYVYFSPDQAYPFEIHGVFRLANVTLDQDLDLTLDGFYKTYLKLGLTEKLCIDFNYEVPDNVRRELAKYQAFISKKSRPLDLSMVKSSTLKDSRGGLNYGQVNLGRGWTTPRRR